MFLVARLLSALLLVLLWMGGESASASSIFQCAQIFSKHNPKEKVWAALNQSELGPQYSWLDRSLEESVRGLSLLKRWRMKWLMKWTNPEVDFLNPYQAENFIHEVFQIFEGPTRLNPYNAESSRAYLTRIAYEQIGARSLVQMAEAMRPEDPGFKFKFKARVSQMFGGPLTSLLAMPPKLPYMNDQRLPQEILNSLLKRREVETLDLFERLLIQGRITRHQYLGVRTYGDRLLIGAAAVLIAMQLQQIHADTQIKAEEAVQAELASVQEKKFHQLQQENQKLQILEDRQRRMQESPVEYMEEFFTQEFTRQQGRAPTAEQKLGIRRLAEEWAKQKKSAN